MDSFKWNNFVFILYYRITIACEKNEKYYETEIEVNYNANEYFNGLFGTLYAVECFACESDISFNNFEVIEKTETILKDLEGLNNEYNNYYAWMDKFSDSIIKPFYFYFTFDAYININISGAYHFIPFIGWGKISIYINDLLIIDTGRICSDYYYSKNSTYLNKGINSIRIEGYMTNYSSINSCCSLYYFSLRYITPDEPNIEKPIPFITSIFII